jgi:hypothetical protein
MRVVVCDTHVISKFTPFINSTVISHGLPYHITLL